MNYRKVLIRAVTFLGGVYFFVKFVLPESSGFGTYHQQISNGFILVGGMAIGLGLINLLLIHGSRLAFLRKGWINSCALLLGLVAMITVTSRDWLATNRISDQAAGIAMLAEFSEAIVADHEARRSDVPPLAVRNQALHTALSRELSGIKAQVAKITTLREKEADQFVVQRLKVSSQDLLSLVAQIGSQSAALEYSSDTTLLANRELASTLYSLSAAWRDFLGIDYSLSQTKRVYSLFNDGLFVPLGAAMFSLLGFYIASAAYRAFRVRSAESGLMMLAALVVMLGQIPFGLWIWGEFPEIRLWLLQVPSTAASRAIEMGAAVGGLIMAFRMWLSIESESYN